MPEDKNNTNAGDNSISEQSESKVSFVPSGLPDTQQPRYHYDIYAILEAPQELYFGEETQVNVNMVEKVKIAMADKRTVEKCYISPTKRRGVERRTLLWSHSEKDHKLLMDALACGIPKTCCERTCPICRVYGGMEAGKKTFIGRLTHSGGVAVVAQPVEEKQRAMHPALICKEEGNYPQPFRKEYAQPGLLYPVSNHCLSLDENEFAVVAYAFLMSLNRLGAGNPKGVALARGVFSQGKPDEPLLVVDRYRIPLGERPVISPGIIENAKAIESFIRLSTSKLQSDRQRSNNFARWLGNEALQYLQAEQQKFVIAFLAQNGTNPWTEEVTAFEKKAEDAKAQKTEDAKAKKKAEDAKKQKPKTKPAADKNQQPDSARNVESAKPAESDDDTDDGGTE